MSDANCFSFYLQKAEPVKGFGKYSEWDKYDIIERLKPLLGHGWKIDPATRKIAVGVQGLTWQTPWFHQRGVANKVCGLWHQIMFNQWGFVPRGCQECWKVVARPRTLKELFQLQDVQRKLDRPAKCGIEVRSYTPAHYGGYFYNASLDEGKECYKIVREAINEAISPDVKVILKRGCTEMELNAGPSALWKFTKEQVELEEYITARVDYSFGIDNSQPDFLLNQLYKRWTLWAHSHNDMTYLEYTDGNVLYPPPVTYHEGDLNEIKKDLQAARMVGAGVPPDKVIEVRDGLLQTMEDFGITPVIAGRAFGYTDINPLFIGEEDQLTYVKGVKP